MCVSAAPMVIPMLAEASARGSFMMPPTKITLLARLKVFDNLEVMLLCLVP